MTVITRIGYCETCARSNSPRTGQRFLAYGSTSNAYFVLEAERNGKIGFTPHLYKLDKVLGQNVIIFKACSIYGCDVDKKKTGQDWWYFVKGWKREVWTLETWNALVLLKNNEFTRDYRI